MKGSRRTRAWKCGLVLFVALGVAAAVHPPRVKSSETNGGWYTWNMNGCLQPCDPTSPDCHC